jgi:hypothetical protein
LGYLHKFARKSEAVLSAQASQCEVADKGPGIAIDTALQKQTVIKAGIVFVGSGTKHDFALALCGTGDKIIITVKFSNILFAGSVARRKISNQFLVDAIKLPAV